MNKELDRIPALAPSFEMSFGGCREELADTVEQVMHVVETLPCAQGRLEGLHLALMEAVTNALIHGNREDPMKIVNICAGCTERSELLICVTDQGEGFDPSTLPDPTVSENLYEGHGRGVFLMKRLVDKVEFNLGGRQVVLRMSSAKSERSTPPATRR